MIKFIIKGLRPDQYEDHILGKLASYSTVYHSDVNKRGTEPQNKYLTIPYKIQA